MTSASFISRSLPPKRIEYKNGNIEIVLRPFEAEDAPKFQETLKETLPSLYKFMLWPVQEWNLEESLEWVLHRHADYFLGKEFEWGCFDLVTGELLGSIGIMPAFSFNPDCYEIGYWTSQKHQGKGLATLGTQIITLIAFTYLQVKRLQVGSATENPSSIRVIEKCGFHYEGKLRGLFPPPSEEKIQKGALCCSSDYLYALLKEDLAHLPWYHTIAPSLSILPIYGDWVTFPQEVQS